MNTTYDEAWFAGAAFRRRLLVGTRTFLSAAILLFVGCKRTHEVIPESPPDAVEAIVEGLKDNQPQVLWNALPESYQTDVKEVVLTFCDHMDPEIYDRAFRILDKAVRVLKEKEEYIFKSPIALSNPILDATMGTRWSGTVDLLNTIAKSDLSSLQSLSRMDPGEFLGSTGHKVMARLDDLRTRSQRSPTPNPWERASQALDDAQIDFSETTDGQGLLRFSSSTNNGVKEVIMTRVEGRWVPTDMASQWEKGIAQAIERMERLSGPEFEKAKPMVSMVLATLEGAMDSLLKAGSQKEFDATLGSLASVGALLQSLRKPNQ